MRYLSFFVFLNCIFKIEFKRAWGLLGGIIVKDPVFVHSLTPIIFVAIIFFFAIRASIILSGGIVVPIPVRWGKITASEAFSKVGISTYDSINFRNGKFAL